MKVSKMKQKLCLLMLAALVVMLAYPVCAMTITMANPQGITERDILVYNSTGQLQGFYNSTSVIPLNGSEDYIFSMKPMQVNVFEDPLAWLTADAFPFVQTYATALLVIAVIVLWLRGGR
jgi:hypothetical protein